MLLFTLSKAALCPGPSWADVTVVTSHKLTRKEETEKAAQEQAAREAAAKEQAAKEQAEREQAARQAAASATAMGTATQILDPNKPQSSVPPPSDFPGQGGAAPGQPGQPGEPVPQPPGRDEKTIEAAVVYYYKDEKGNLRAVDSLDAVPEKFKAKAKKVQKRE